MRTHNEKNTASPELPTPQEQKAIDHLIDLQIDEATEEKHIHEIMVKDEELDETI